MKTRNFYFQLFVEHHDHKILYMWSIHEMAQLERAYFINISEWVYLSSTYSRSYFLYCPFGNLFLV